MLTLRRDDPVAVVTTIREGDLRSLQRLLEKHPGVASARIQDQKGGLRTLLHVATDWPGHFPNCAAVIRVLIRSGGNPNVQIEGSSHPETPVLSKYSAAGVPVGGRNSVESCRGSRRILGRLEHDARSRPGRLPLAHATALMHSLVLDLAAFNGMEMENMTRGHGWRFLDLGRRLERSLSVLKLLQGMVKVESSRHVLEPVLEIADSVMTYRRRYFNALHLTGVLDLLIRDESNPRSLIFQINVLNSHATALASGSKSVTGQLDLARIQSLADAIRSRAPDELTEQASESASHVPGLLNSWAAGLAELSDDVTNRYFSHSIPRPS